MKRRLLPILAAMLMLVVMIPAFTLTADAASVPTKFWVEATETNNIPAQIDLFRVRTGGTNQNPTYTYQLYLPGNVNLNDVKLCWDGDLTTTVNNQTYSSGDCPVPPVNTQQSYSFRNGYQTTTFNLITYQGSPGVQRVFIDIDESKGTIAAMDGDANHNTECKGRININGEWMVLDKMKGRGNATWESSRDKRPYNVTLGSKITFPGIDAEPTKKWSFMAEVTDHSLLCNRIGFYLAHEMGIGQATTSADVWMNGEYQGCYMITPKTDSYVSKKGFMIEQDNYLEVPVAQGGDPQFRLAGLEEKGRWESDHNLITVKKIGDNLLPGGDDTPENLENVATNTIKPWLQDAWDAIRSSDGYNSKGKYYTDYIDIESFAKMYLMHEYVKSYDVCAGSILFHRDGMSDSDKLFAGPMWDLDNALGSVCNNDDLGSVSDRRSAQGVFIKNVTEYKTSIYKTIGRHEDFMEEVQYQYNKYRSAFNNLPGALDQMKSDIEASARMNHMKVEEIEGRYKNLHKYSSQTTLGSNPYRQTYLATTDSKTDWGNYVANLRTYIFYRSLWFKNNYTDPSYVDPAECEHEYAVIETVPATCKASGFAKYRCPKCRDTYTETLPMLPHDYQEGICSMCGEVLLTATIHCSPGASVTVYETQDVNGAHVDNATEAHPRDSETGMIDCYVDESGEGSGQINFKIKLDPCYELVSMTAEPKAAYKNLKSDKNDPMLYRATKVNGDFTITVTAVESHAFGELVPEQAATCTEAGMAAHYQCAVCHKFFDENQNVTTEEDLAIPETGHTEEEIPAVPATCTKAGSTAGKKCSVCGEILVEPEEIAATGHTAGEPVKENEVAATCEKAGSYDEVVYCTVCNDELSRETRTIAALGHKYGDLIREKTATCTADGMAAHYQCSVCHKYFDADKEETTEEDLAIPATGHTEEEIPAVPATCTEAGSTAGKKCSVCGEILVEPEEIPATGHKPGEPVKEKEVAATCEKAGSYDEVVYCTVCNDELSRETRTIAALGHKYGDLIREKTATCTADGMAAHYQCSVCHKYFDANKEETTEEDLTIAATGHTEEEIPAVPATCTKAGSTAGKKCSVCGEILVEPEEIPATGHKPGEPVKENEVAATCETAGSYDEVVYCTVCNEELSRETRTIAALGHKYGDLIREKSATCTVDGMAAHYQCSVCHKYFDADKEETTEEDLAIPATGHTPGEAVKENEVAATCDKAGSYDEVVYCTVCNDELSRETRTVAALGHTEEEIPAVPATCTKAGSTAGKKCSVCGEILVEPEEIPATGHKPGEPVKENEVAATCEKAGSYDEVVYCTVCNDELSRETRTVAALGHTEEEIPAVPATCTEAGSTAGKKCSVCGAVLVEPEEIPALGHAYGDWEVSRPATCTKTGEEKRVCGNDASHEETRDLAIDPDAHDWGEWEITEPTETSPGEQVRICKNDPNHKERIEIPPLEHRHVLSHVDAVEPTCTEEGSNEYWVCDEGQNPCGLFFKDEDATEILADEDRIVPALGHDWGDWDVTTEPTCTEEGVETRVCKNDKTHNETRAIAATGHTPGEPVKENEVAATCEKAGSYDEVVYCAACNEELSRETKEVAALGHSWDEGEVTKKATETEEGVMTYTCTVCGETRTEAIPKVEPEKKPEPAPEPSPAPQPEPGSDPEQKGTDGTYLGPGASAAAAEKAITGMPNDSDPPGAVYGKIKAKSTKQTKSSVKVTWSKTKGAVKYVIYGNACGKKNKMKKLATSTGKSKTFRKINGKKVKKGTYYKFIVVALDKDNNVVSTSKVIHAATKGGKVGNHKSVKVSKSVISKAKKLKKGKTLKLNAKAVKGKLTVKKHRGIKYESSNTKVATVNKKGVVKAKGKGTCYIYAYAQNGIAKKVKVSVAE